MEMHVAQALREHADKVEGSEQWPFAAVADALEVIPRTLCQNCGGDTVRVMSKLRSMHADGEKVRVAASSSYTQQVPLPLKCSVLPASAE